MENQNNQQKDYTKMDDKTIATIKASAIWSAVSAIITSVASMLASYFFLRNIYSNMMGAYGNYLGQAYAPQLINVPGLIGAVIWGAIGGAIAGWIIAKFYPVFVGWQKKFLGGKLDTFFKLLFWPNLAGFAIALVLGGAISLMYSGFIAFVITIVADIAAAYLYAKMMDKAVGKYYAQ